MATPPDDHHIMTAEYWEAKKAAERMAFKPGYHLRPIQKGVLGDISKIREELEELEDAAEQGVTIMMMVELSDMYGAIEAYAEKLGINMNDVAQMSAVTKRAFVNGRRG